MRVLVYGSDTVANRISPLLNSGGVEMIAVSNKSISWKNLSSGALNEAAMAIVDVTEPNANRLCHYFWQAHVPLVLLTDNQADWARLCGHEAYAYIPYAAGELEFAIRLKNIISCVGQRQTEITGIEP